MRLLTFFCALALAAISLTGGTAWAQQASWRITAREGVVRVYEPAHEPADAAANQSLRAGTTVTTGADSRATLENGAQRIVMTPNSRMTIAPDSNDAMTRILQDLGSLLFQVDRRDAQHFRVETPLLAAVVKGTTFTVSAGPQQDRVHVAQGLVEVRANAGSAVHDVAAGVTASISRNMPDAIAMLTPAEPAGVAQAVAAPALDYAAVSGGVVEAPHPASAAHDHSSNNRGGQNAGVERGNDRGANLFGQSMAAVRSMLASLTGGRGNAGGNGNGNAGGNGNGNAGGNGNGNAGGNGNGNAGGNGNGNGNDAENPPVCQGRRCTP